MKTFLSKYKILAFLFPFSMPIYATIPEKVVICGVCKNVEQLLPYSIKTMEKMGDLFEDYRILVYENDSEDQTKNRLSTWAEENPKVSVFMENLTLKEIKKTAVNTQTISLEDPIFEFELLSLETSESDEENDLFESEKHNATRIVAKLSKEKNKPNYYGMTRVESIARARNIILDKVLSDAYAEYTYVIWIDMDFKTVYVEDAIHDIFQNTEDWNAIFSYGITKSGHHHDWFAFRDTKKVPLGPELIGKSWWGHWPQIKFHDEAWYPVLSAFGGLGIYKRSSLLGCRYSSFITPEWETITQKLIHDLPKHPLVEFYQQNLKNFTKIVKIKDPIPELPMIRDLNTGIILHDNPNPIIWRMLPAAFSYQYPCICEHVGLHASMILKGHDKLFIHPKLICVYEKN